MILTPQFFPANKLPALKTLSQRSLPSSQIASNMSAIELCQYLSHVKASDLKAVLASTDCSSILGECNKGYTFYGVNLLNLAILNPNLEVFELLLNFYKHHKIAYDNQIMSRGNHENPQTGGLEIFYGDTPLAIALRQGDERKIEYLISHELNVLYPTLPFYSGCRREDYEYYPLEVKMLEYLCWLGAQRHWLNPRNDEEQMNYLIGFALEMMPVPDLLQLPYPQSHSNVRAQLDEYLQSYDKKLHLKCKEKYNLPRTSYLETPALDYFSLLFVPQLYEIKEFIELWLPALLNAMREHHFNRTHLDKIVSSFVSCAHSNSIEATKNIQDFLSRINHSPYSSDFPDIELIKSLNKKLNTVEEKHHLDKAIEISTPATKAMIAKI